MSIPISAGRALLRTASATRSLCSAANSPPAHRPLTVVPLQASPPGATATMMPSLPQIAVGGHRGNGTNLLQGTRDLLHPSIRENTLKSMSAAVAAGASFLEFDVQVTSCGTPVLWHDDLIVMTGQLGETIKVPVRDLSLAQFTSLTCSNSSATLEQESVAGSSAGSSPRSTTSLLRQFDDGPDEPLPWECTMDDTLPTLDAVFKGVPEEVGLNIEIKMAVPNDSITSPEEVQRVVGPILATVDRHTSENSNRSVTFSSFDPDVCVATRTQQSRYPVVFLSGCGIYPHVDKRRTSIDAAINHAASVQLAGIVVPASVLLAHPAMVAQAQAVQLAVLTYGRDNNQPEVVRQQAALGVAGVILDEVARVVMDLRQPAAIAADGDVGAAATAMALAAAMGLSAPAAPEAAVPTLAPRTPLRISQLDFGTARVRVQ